jgi:hypothetical protein
MSSIIKTETDSKSKLLISENINSSVEQEHELNDKELEIVAGGCSFHEKIRWSFLCTGGV